jgi:hypothetical protein
VKLSSIYASCSDAAGGPLRPGDIGKIIEADTSEKPYLVQADSGQKWWYTADAVDPADTPPSGKGDVVTQRTILAGRRVRRGPDWKWEEQDGSGVGVIQGPAEKDGWVSVHWESGGKNAYRVSGPGEYDLVFADDGPEALGVVTQANIKIGGRVRRGPDWKWQEQDGNGPGVILRPDGDGWVRVKWDNGNENSYRVKGIGEYDLIYLEDGGRDERSLSVIKHPYPHRLKPVTMANCGCDVCGEALPREGHYRCDKGCNWDICGVCLAKHGHYGEFRKVDGSQGRQYCSLEKEREGLVCTHPDGILQKDHWSCCGGPKDAPGCYRPAAAVRACAYLLLFSRFFFSSLRPQPPHARMQTLLVCLFPCLAHTAWQAASGSAPSGKITVGSLVQVVDGADSDGPLKPGDIGVVIVDDGSSVPFRVRAPNEKEWWYNASDLKLAPAGSQVRRSTISRKAGGVSSSLSLSLSLSLSRAPAIILHAIFSFRCELSVERIWSLHSLCAEKQHAQGLGGGSGGGGSCQN